LKTVYISAPGLHVNLTLVFIIGNNRRLGGVLPGTLYLTRVDEFSNPMEFTRIPTDIKCDIYTVEGDQVEISIVVGKGLIKISDDHLSLEIPV
jgi:hypothetical protein